MSLGYYKLFRVPHPGVYQSIAILPSNWMTTYQPGVWNHPAHARSRFWCYTSAAAASRQITSNRVPHGYPIELWTVDTIITYHAKCCVHLGNAYRDVYMYESPYEIVMDAEESVQLALHNFWKNAQFRNDYDHSERLIHVLDTDTVVVADKVKMVAPLIRYEHAGEGVWRQTVMHGGDNVDNAD